MDIFEKLPKIVYNQKNSTNIMVNINVVRKLLKKYEIFYPYSIKEGERPDTIAHDYYGSSDYEWLVCLPNKIFDMSTDWIMSYNDFNQYIISTYGSIVNAKETIIHYKYNGLDTDTLEKIQRKNWLMTPETYQQFTVEEKSGWEPVFYYDYEMELNEKKRNINLISNQYIPQINRELEKLLG